ncbi:hypothetical protein FO519_001393 [Halicephalobus sp. NKZ332]|nr:hypothetical protein FO519_001393 [Halicephalobus sp. NKZ332]
MYALITYFALIGRGPFIPGDNDLPFFHVPEEYNITLKFDEDYLKKSLKFTGTTRMLFESTVVTPNFFVNIGENMKINQLYFEHYPQGDSFSAIETGFDTQTQIQGYVINHVFEEKGKYVAVFDFEGEVFPANSDFIKPLRIVNFKNSGQDTYSIIHVNSNNVSYGLRYITPSLDSNNYPAKFILSLQKKKEFNSVSNMPLEGSMDISSTLNEDDFSQSIVLLPSQLSFAIFNLENLTKKNCQSGMTIGIHYRSEILQKVSSPNRLLQIIANGSNIVEKVDGLILPGIESRSQPGISFLEEQHALTEAETLSDKIPLMDSC